MKGVTSMIRTVIDAAWRRRYLVVVPAILFTLIGLAVAINLPRTYESRMLLLLQEEGGADPLRSDGAAVRWDPRARISALRALAESDYTIRLALTELYGEDIVRHPKEYAILADDLRDRFAIRLIGTQFVEISLVGSEPVDLRDELNAIFARLLESMLLPAESSQDVTSYLIDLRRKKLDELKARFEELRSEAGDLSSAALDRKRAARDAAALARTQAQQALDEKQAVFDRTFDALVGSTISVVSRNLESEIESAAETIESIESDPQASPEKVAAAREKYNGLIALREDAAEIRGLQERSRTALSELSRANDAVRKQLEYQRRLESISTEIADNEEQLATYSQRFRARTPQALHLLGSPEQIKVVDPANIPEQPTNSRLTVLLIAIGAGVVIGVGLGVVAELLDQGVRSPADVESNVGLPTLGRLPRLSAEELELIQQMQVRARRRSSAESASFRPSRIAAES